MRVLVWDGHVQLGRVEQGYKGKKRCEGDENSVAIEILDSGK